jgi:uncharacterized protein
VSHPVQPPARPSRTRRGPVRRYLETRGVLGDHATAAATVPLRATDGVRLAASYLPGPADAQVAVLLAHGFAANRRKPAYAQLADGLARVAPVLSLDLRGHGRSAGRSTWGDREADDVAAGVAWLRGFGHDRVVLVGASMGATAVLHAASRGSPIAGLVAVSAPAWFRDQPETAAMVRLQGLWHSPVQRALLRWVVGVHLGGPDEWRSPPHPAEMATALRCPMLVVHGTDDAYFPMGDAEALVAARGNGAVLWREPAGFGHAEDGLTEPMVDRLTDAIATLGATGRFPAATP